ncbi:hypothetical protein Aduo_006165 [Ancylostoma duodenale]
MRTFLCATCAVLSIVAHVSAEEGAVKSELSDAAKEVLTKVQSLREQEKKEIQKIENKEERDLVETMAIEAEVKDLKAERPKRDTPTDLFSLLKPKTVEPKPDKARETRQVGLRARRVRRNKQRRAAAAARRNAKLRRVRRNRVAARQARARLIRRLQRAKINQSNKRAAEAKLADQLKKE